MPADAYGDAKSEAEAECESRAGGQDVVRARPFNHTGPGQSSDFVCSDFASQVVDCERGEEPGLIRVGDLRSERDFSDVRDVVRAYKLLFDHGVAGQAYNICSGRPAAVSRVLDILISLSTADIKVEVETERLRPGEVGRLWGSYAKLRALTGWEPQIALEATLADLLEDRRSDGAV